jgi:hypothetical protein
MLNRKHPAVPPVNACRLTGYPDLFIGDEMTEKEKQALRSELRIPANVTDDSGPS